MNPISSGVDDATWVRSGRNLIASAMIALIGVPDVAVLLAVVRVVPVPDLLGNVGNIHRVRDLRLRSTLSSFSLARQGLDFRNSYNSSLSCFRLGDVFVGLRHGVGDGRQDRV